LAAPIEPSTSTVAWSMSVANRECADIAGDAAFVRAADGLRGRPVKAERLEAEGADPGTETPAAWARAGVNAAEIGHG